MRKLAIMLSILVLVGIFAHSGYVSAQSYANPDQNFQIVHQNLWTKTYVIISMQDIKVINDWNYIFQTLPPKSPGIMIMWYGLGTDYKQDFQLMQKFIDEYKQKFPDKKVIELYMTTQMPTTGNQTVNITTPILKNVDYIITFDDVGKLVKSVPADELKNVKIIASYVYEVKQVPVETNTTNTTKNATVKTKTITTENPSWNEIVSLSKKYPITGVMIYTNDNQKLAQLIDRAKKDGFKTYTIILPTPTLFGGVDMMNTYEKIVGALQYYDYVLFYSWDSITPNFNYFMKGGSQTSTSSTVVSSKTANTVGTFLQWLPEVLLLVAIVGGALYAHYSKKKGEQEKKENKKKKKGKKNKDKDTDDTQVY